MRILLVAEEAAGIQVLRALGDRPHEVVAVMAREDHGSGTGRSMWDVATNIGHETWPVRLVQDEGLAERIRDHGIDLVLNVHSLYIVHASALDAAPLGWYNLHPGSLPDYAGLNTVSWAIYHGRNTQTVTVHRMVASVDAGPIAYEEDFPIGESDTALAVSAKSVRLGVELILRLVDQAADDPSAIPATEQDLEAFRYYGASPPERGILSWDRSAERAAAFIRAFDYFPLPSPWGPARAEVAGHTVGVLGATRTHSPTDQPPGSVAPGQSGSILVACADEWVEIRRFDHDGRIIAADQLTKTQPVGGSHSR